MPHRSPDLLNPSFDSVGGVNLAKSDKITFRHTFSKIFDPMIEEASSGSKAPSGVEFLHSLYLDLMAMYDLDFFVETALPKLVLEVDSETKVGLELLLLGLSQAAKVLDPSNDFRQKYVTVHEQIGEAF